jgi:hypothetical protein
VSVLVGMTPWLSAGRRVRQRKVAPHIAEYENGNLAKNILTAKEKIDKRRRMSQNKRKVIERVFGWAKWTARFASSSYVACSGWIRSTAIARKIRCDK